MRSFSRQATRALIRTGQNASRLSLPGGRAKASLDGKRAWIFGAALLARVAAGLVWRQSHEKGPNAVGGFFSGDSNDRNS